MAGRGRQNEAPHAGYGRLEYTYAIEAVIALPGLLAGEVAETIIFGLSVIACAMVEGYETSN